MIISTEPIGTIPRPCAIGEAIETRDGADRRAKLAEKACEGVPRAIALPKIRMQVAGTVFAEKIMGTR